MRRKARCADCAWKQKPLGRRSGVGSTKGSRGGPRRTGVFGMLERSAAAHDLPALIESTQDLHPREAARFLIEHVVQAHDGRLDDDATVMCLDWYGTESTRRDADQGADVSEASPTAGQHTSPSTAAGPRSRRGPAPCP
ncbi:hypothetical protein ACFYM7_28305 [Streptomyces cyaneofuscatus]|uniref:hypothetical protein n=1 Tax=Streptomyces cyaneofuscatus TaxID=66883 RepID=UPI0036CA9319